MLGSASKIDAQELPGGRFDDLLLSKQFAGDSGAHVSDPELHWLKALDASCLALSAGRQIFVIK